MDVQNEILPKGLMVKEMFSLWKCLNIPHSFTSKKASMDGCKSLQAREVFYALVVGQGRTWILVKYSSIS